MGIGDLTFNLNTQAYQVLLELSKIDILDTDSLWNVTTHTWYNGRERGFVISTCGYNNRPINLSSERSTEYKLHASRSLHIAIFEHRNSNEICALMWNTERPYWNGPQADENTLKEAYHGGDKYEVDRMFKDGQYEECAQWIEVKIKSFIATSKMTEEV